ncbi:hypothetical protein SETIT_8G089600v2 [Setaria italica]|uniref:Uncharacterized protein n=1 Tax=Setaria italica TaxID=4555 RepID=A0A368S5S5_SETIT|nr:hypothetical protein SETIT_8G089600v2 [Setaria italica]
MWYKHVYEGPITRSRVKKLQQEVHAFLVEINFNIPKNFILPKSFTLVMIRFTHEDVGIAPHGDETQQSDQTTRNMEMKHNN